ncbi:MAG: c-type cytochrome [Terriglobia bacterium]|jgi:mono/diheme cytochrome c family protein|nr:c-type cytochrome [Terriglobia bacterium]
MRKFVLGFVTGIVVLLLAVFCYVRFGFVDPRADKEVSLLESKIAMPALDAAVDRRASEAQNPIQPTDANLTAGMKVYQRNCASCHGDIQRPRASLADTLYPRAPQFLEDAPDMPEKQNFYIIQHGVRMSGMPAWKQVLSEQEIWQVTTFLNHMDKLPPQVSDLWKAAASGSPDANSSPDTNKMQMKDKKGMKMPM